MLTALAILACTPESTTALGPRGPCNPVDPSQCVLPYPSSYFLEEDPGTVTGFRVAFHETSLPVNVDGIQTTPGPWNTKDGFSTVGSLLLHLPGATASGLVTWTDPSGYLAEDVRTLVVDTVTGERVPHFAELESPLAPADRRLLLIRPLVPLEHDRTYAVGVRGVVDEGGAPLPPLAGFQRLRDQDLAGAEADLLRQEERYESFVFPALEDAGFQRGELQAAWDFHTLSVQSSLGDMVSMRDDVLSRIPAEGPDFTIVEVQAEDCAASPPRARVVRGTVRSPSYLSERTPGARLSRDGSGAVAYVEDVDVPFTAAVPCTLLTDPRPGRPVQMGHGLFGDQSQAVGDWILAQAEAYGWVPFAVDWLGVASDDLETATFLLLGDLADFQTVPDRLHQAMMEQVVVGRLFTGPVGTDPAFQQGGVSVIDPEALVFYGVSMGAVEGGAYVGLSTDVERAVFVVGGMPVSLLLTRSWGFTGFLQLLAVMLPDWADISVTVQLMQQLWEPAEAGGWAHYVNPPDGRRPEDVLLGARPTPTKEVLSQVALGDGLVAAVGSHWMARAYGQALLQPGPRSLWGLTDATMPHSGPAIIEVDYGTPDPLEAVVAEERIHYDMVEHPLRGAQVDQFFRGVPVEPFCDGVCDPE